MTDHLITWCSFFHFQASFDQFLRVCVSDPGDMSESKAHHVEIRDVDGQTLLKLVDYIYTAEIEVSEDNVQVMDLWRLDCFTHN